MPVSVPNESKIRQEMGERIVVSLNEAKKLLERAEISISAGRLDRAESLTVLARAKFDEVRTLADLYSRGIFIT